MVERLRGLGLSAMADAFTELQHSLSAIPIGLSHAVLMGRDPAIRGLPGYSSGPPLSYACNAHFHSDLLDRQGEYITDAVLGPDDPGCTRVSPKLAPEPQDLHVDTTIKHVLVTAGGLQQILAA
jgi:hypothetical protein